MTKVIFYVPLFFIAYTYLGYGVLILTLSRLFAKPINKKDFKPKITVLISAYNEEKVIKERVNNILVQKYPKDLIKVIIVSAGSTDRTADIISEIDSPNVKLIEISEKIGKAQALNQAMSLCDTEFIVLADARQKFDKKAISKLMENFADEKVGAVSGELCFEKTDKTGVGEGIDFYWNYEKLLRKAESRVDSTVGATGAIYAIRKSLFKPIPADSLLDDVIIPMNIVIQGFRCVFEEEAKAYDMVANKHDHEARRKIRTIAGNFQLFFRFKSLLNPFKNRIWFQTFSHKFLRIIAPIFIAMLLISNLFLIEDIFFRALLFLQIIFYLFGIFGYSLRHTNIKFKLFSVPQTFIMLNIITIRAFWEYLFNDPQSLWRKGIDGGVCVSGDPDIRRSGSNNVPDSQITGQPEDEKTCLNT